MQPGQESERVMPIKSMHLVSFEKKIFLIVMAVCLFDFFITIEELYAKEKLKDIKIGIINDSMPQFAIDPSGKARGSTIDIINAIARETKCHVTFVDVNSWEEALTLLKKDIVDAIPSCGISTQQIQDENLIASFPFETFQVRLFFKKGSFPFSSRKKMTLNTIGVVKGSPSDRYLQKANIPFVIRFDTMIENLFGLLKGEVNASIAEEEVFLSLARQIKEDHSIFSYGYSLLKSETCLIVKKDNQRLVTLINDSIDKFLRTNNCKSIYKKWYIYTPFWNLTKLISVMVAILISIICFFQYVHHKERTISQKNIELNEKRLAAQYNSIPTPTYTWHKEKNELILINFNKVALSFSPERLQKGLGSSIKTLFNDISAIEKMVESCFMLKCPLEESVSFFSNNAITHWHVLCSFVPPDLVLMHIEDVTSNYNAQKKENEYKKKLRGLASTLSKAEEQERRRISTLIHDAIGQPLALAKIRAVMLSQEIKNNTFKEDLSVIIDQLDSSISTTRTLTFDLGTPVLYKLGFVPAIEWLIGRLEDQFKLDLVYENRGVPKYINDDIKSFLFRSIHELIINVIKHAETKQVCLRTSQWPSGSLIVIVSDNGKGFSAKEYKLRAPFINSFGLFSLEERINYLGGKFKIFSKPGQGTTVSFVVPPSAFGEVATDENSSSG